VTLAELTAARAAVYSAWLAALSAPKSYTRGSAGGSSMSVQAQDIKVLKEQLDMLDAQIAQAGGTVSKTVYVRPQDA